jgi:hypothetical protein
MKNVAFWDVALRRLNISLNKMCWLLRPPPEKIQIGSITINPHFWNLHCELLSVYIISILNQRSISLCA